LNILWTKKHKGSPNEGAPLSLAFVNSISGPNRRMRMRTAGPISEY